MSQSNKLLVGIVVGMIVLIIVALVIAVNRPEPEFQIEDSPEGIAHNYLLALQQSDYARAYDYLSANIACRPVPERCQKDHPLKTALGSF